MTLFVRKKKQADVIVMDPRIGNKRALRCYEKCGFNPIAFLPTHEWHEGKYHDCLLTEVRTSQCLFNGLTLKKLLLDQPSHDQWQRQWQ